MLRFENEVKPIAQNVLSVDDLSQWRLYALSMDESELEGLPEDKKQAAIDYMKDEDKRWALIGRKKPEPKKEETSWAHPWTWGWHW